MLIFIVGSVLILSLNESHKELQIVGKSLFEWVDWISANVIMTFGGIATCVFVGYAIKKRAFARMDKGLFWSRYVCILAFCYQDFSSIYGVCNFCV